MNLVVWPFQGWNKEHEAGDFLRLLWACFQVFSWETKGKLNQNNFLAVQFPASKLHIPGNLKPWRTALPSVRGLVQTPVEEPLATERITTEECTNCLKYYENKIDLHYPSCPSLVDYDQLITIAKFKKSYFSLPMCVMVMKTWPVRQRSANKRTSQTLTTPERYSFLKTEQCSLIDSVQRWSRPIAWD